MRECCFEDTYYLTYLFLWCGIGSREFFVSNFLLTCWYWCYLWTRVFHCQQIFLHLMISKGFHCNAKTFFSCIHWGQATRTIYLRVWKRMRNRLWFASLTATVLTYDDCFSSGSSDQTVKGLYFSLTMKLWSPAQRQVIVKELDLWESNQ